MKITNIKRRTYLALLLSTWILSISYIIIKSNTTGIIVTDISTQGTKSITVTNEFTNSKDTKRFDSSVRKVLNRWQIKGATVAVMRNNKLVYVRGFGHSNVEQDVDSQPYDLYRIASMSKLITAIAIMRLVDDGVIKLSDNVFGEDGILGKKYPELRDKRMNNIKVEHLLRHEAGFTVPMGDPMFKLNLVKIGLGVEYPITTKDIIDFQVSRKLGYTPGRSKKYSNVGYLVLSDIISQVSGMSYEKYVKTEILLPIGCYDTHLANNLYADRYANEVKYYSGSKHDFLPSVTGSGVMLPKAYGGNDVRGLLGAGAWVSTTFDMLKIAMSIDGKNGQREVNDILSAKSILKMKTYVRNRLPIGWASVRNGVLERTGSFSGTTTIMNHNPNGTSWIILANTSSYIGYRLNNSFKSMMRNSLSLLPKYPSSRDLFDHDYLDKINLQLELEKTKKAPEKK